MKTGRGWWALAGMVGVPMLLLALYVGAYYALVTPTRVWPGFSATRSAISPEYPVAIREHASRIFRPMWRIDRQLRPDTWDADKSKLPPLRMNGGFVR
jgi:hypothetical protein